MRILVLGAYGLIGSHVAAHLHAAGYEVVGAGRDIDAAVRRMPHLRWVAADLAKLRQPEDWHRHLAGIHAVVNCAGALQASPRDDIAAVHVDGPLALYRACAGLGIRRVVHVSAASVAAGRPTAFNTTKQRMEELLKPLDLDWVILRPGLVLAPAAYGGTALLRGLAGFPWFIPTVHPERIAQVISVHDVTEAILRALSPPSPARISVDLLHEAPTRLAEIVTALRGWLGFPPAKVIAIPTRLAGLAAKAGDALAVLGWRPPIRSTTLAQLGMGVTGDGAACERAFGFRPASLSQMLAQSPSSVQERWFARLYFIKPLALLALVLFWLLSGLIGLATVPAAAAVLERAGWPAILAIGAVVAGSLVDIALGALAAFRRTAPTALKGMIAVSVLYLLGGTLARPDLWADPLGPLLKVVPGMVLALAALAVMDER
ncbi:SDR family oxidoreductase [Starkeya sp. ORNL1]|uniref:SDR family oxidoreductase n=1 Tax=Starkeya sp. ORNL1 TaxID=2709380 RepID=UPI0014642498|nr:SDR family oxidoreductase [Starkeya sp. ORNL1]QJP13313.1 SDR family oxidoreductase [Starkeya sp. ORNL1]